MTTPKPKYQPDTWVLFSNGTSHVVAKVLGAVFDKGQWHYFLTPNPSRPEVVRAVPEAEVLETIK